MLCPQLTFSFFFFNDTATTEIYTLSLHDALPISQRTRTAILTANYGEAGAFDRYGPGPGPPQGYSGRPRPRSEEHTSEIPSHFKIVCRLLLLKKKKRNKSVNFM